MTIESSQLALIGAFALLFAGAAAGQEDHRIEKRVIVIDGDSESAHPHAFAHAIANHEMDCHEEDGKTICVATVERGDSEPGERPMALWAGRHHRALFGGTFLGVELTETTPELRQHLGGPCEAGVLISRIQEGSPAAQAGIEVGDIVTAVDGEAVESAADLKHAVTSHDAGDAVAIELYRDGRMERLTATLGEREPPAFLKHWSGAHGLMEKDIEERIHQALDGIDLEDLGNDVRKQLDSVDWQEIRRTIREALDRALEDDK